MNTKHCNGTFSDTKLVSGLEKVIGNNQTLITGIVTKVVKNFTDDGRFYEDDFVRFIESNYKKLLPELEKSNVNKALAEAMLDYYNQTAKRVSSFVKKEKQDRKVITYGYTSTTDRNIGIGFAVIDVLNRFQDSGMTLDSKKEYLVHLKNTWFTRLAQLAVDTKVKRYNENIKYTTVEEVREDYKRNVQGKIDEIEAKYNDLLNKEIDEASYEIPYGPELDETIEEITDRINAEKAKELTGVITSYQFFSSIFEGKLDNTTVKNTLAFYNELMSDNQGLLDDILYSSKAQDIYHKINHDEKITNEQLEEGESTFNNIEDATEDGNADLDMSVQSFEHSGIYKSYMVHIGARLRNYFNTLPRLLDNTQLDSYVTDNIYCIPECMDARECCTELYNANINWNNLEEMIATINDIAAKKPEFYGFAKLANDLRTDPDLATELATVFSKIKIDKVEVVERNGQVNTNIANNTANGRNILVGSFLNDAKNNLDGNIELLSGRLNIFKENSLSVISDIYSGVNNKTTKFTLSVFQEDVNRAKEEVIKLIKFSYPSVSSIAIKSYIELNDNGEDIAIKRQIKNIQLLYSIASQINTDATNAKLAKIDIEKRYWQAVEHNENLQRDLDSGINTNEEQIDTKAIRNDDSYVNNFYTSVNRLVNEILPYTAVKIELNHRNIEGNNNSDIINNSALGAIHKMMAQTKRDADGKVINPVLLNWVLKKMALPQYRYNTILKTKRDEQGNITQYGLVEWNDDTQSYELCDWAPELFDVQLFQGSTSMSENKNLPYPKMTKGDYIPTRFCAFFTTNAVFGTQETQGKVATYFTKTPSDAPKVYTYRAPKFATKGLMQIVDEESFNNEISEAVKSLIKPTTSKEEYDSFYANYVNTDVFNKWLDKDNDKNRWNLWFSPLYRADEEKIVNLEGEELRITRKESVKILDDNTAVVVFKTSNGTVFAIQGEIFNRNGSQYLKNCNILQTAVMPFQSLTAMEQTINKFEEYYKEEAKLHDVTLTNGTVISKPEFKVDTNHSVFKILRQQYYQELLDAVNALYTIFKFKTPQTISNGEYVDEQTDELVIQIDKNTNLPIFRPGFNQNSGYRFYHKGSKGNIFEVKDGKAVLKGKVFNSNKFTLVRDVQTKNGVEAQFVNYLDNSNNAIVDLLYGAAIRVRSVLNPITNKTEIEFNFAEDQRAEIEANIDAKLSEFVIDYIEQANIELSKYSEFTNDIKVNSERNIEYALNELIMAFNADLLFDGNTKFYKDAQTVLKRLKQTQGSGVPYGIADTSGNIIDPVNTEVSLSMLNSPEIQEGFKGTILEGVKQTYGFYGVTISNSVRTNHKALEDLVHKLVKDCNIKEKQAYDILFGKVEYDENGKPKRDKDGNVISKGGFTNTKVNDAQSYITIQEFVRRIAARGQLKKYLPLINKVLDENSVLTADEIKEFIQVQKNFYYDMYYDETYNMEVPRQIKNAEFVLVPRFIRGTQLEQVYNVMRENGIDQLNTIETSKAANKEILHLWDNNGDITEANIKEFSDKAIETKQVFTYDKLYTQQETPQHMNAENKAGIQIVKKILDNLPNTKEWNDIKAAYFDLFTANIIESFEKVAKEFDFAIDENSNFDFSNGDTLKINKEKFFNKLKEELMRNGLDDNMLKCVTIEEDETEPSMPLTMNNLISKFESVTQSIFNSNITRQKLPGFHAAQVTNVGWKGIETVIPNYVIDKLENNSYYKEFKESYNKDINTKTINKETYLADDTKADFVAFLKDKFKNVTYNKELRYHPNNEPYIEILVPYSFLGIDKNSPYYKNKTDEEILKELSEQGKDGKFGLNDLIGYRIPTEGKQSMCNMKVVGFVDDALGSTIIVPDDWVSQTGSDFDIDSVYAITYEVKKAKNGKITKYKYNNEPTKKDWILYLDKNSKAFYNTFIKNRHADLMEEEDVVFKSLSANDKKLIKSIHKRASNAASKVADSTKRQAFINQITAELKTIETNRSKFNNDIDAYVQKRTKIKQYLESVYDSISQEELDKFAEDKHLYSLDFYLDKKNINKVNNRKQRNTRILELMQTILSSNEALEENLSRSNFDDITDAKNEVMSDYTKNHREGRSPYNPFDQAAYQEEAMSGAKLKGFSVTLDTLCSVCNTVKPTLGNPITIVYDNTDGRYDIKGLKERFGAKSSTNSVSITHNTYGWSKDNRNVVGKLLTAYSSQTTAFILDAIKEGSIENVNDYTFAVFKTFANIGSDYRTSISFITQPGIRRIVDEYNKNKSVFSNESGNAINKAIEAIARELGIPNTNGSIISILGEINKHYNKEFKAIFGINDKEFNISLHDSNTSKIPIYAKKLKDRIDGVGFNLPVERLLFDLGTILQFNYIHNIAQEIGDIARCCNPDKFGAKQTVFATRQVFNQIANCIENSKKDNPILGVNGRHVLDAIYPGVEDEVKNGNRAMLYKHILQSNNIEQSAYPTLYAYLKYASATSVAVAKSLFDTQSDEFVALVEGIVNVFSKDIGKDFDEETANDVQRYILSSFYNTAQSIKMPVSITLAEDGTFEFVAMEDNKQNQSNIETETTRIYGYGYPAAAAYDRVYETEDGRKIHTMEEFTCEDINNPTQEELDSFVNLSPAQKVFWIRNNFDDAGIFEYITPNLATSVQKRQQTGVQTLSYKEEQIDPNTILAEFNRAFNSSNPLIALTALDVIKYSIQVEGMIMSNNAVNKVIDYSTLIMPLNEGGIGFVDNYNEQFADLYNGKSSINKDDNENVLYENYLRSHPNCKFISSFNYNTKGQKNKAGLRLVSDYSYQVLPNYDEQEVPDMEGFYKRVKSLHLGTVRETKAGTSINWNSYVRMNTTIKGAPTSILYKIIGTDTGCFMYPLSNLQTNENSRYSVNPENTEHILSQEYYLDLFDKISKEDLLSLSYKDRSNKISELSKEVKQELIDNNPEDKNIIRKSRTVYSKVNTELNFNAALTNDTDRLYSVVNGIKEYFEKRSAVEGPVFVVNNETLANVFLVKGKKGAVTTTMTINGENRTFKVYNFTTSDTKVHIENRKNGLSTGSAEYDAILDSQIEKGYKMLSNAVAIIEIEPSQEAMAAATLESSISESVSIIASAALQGNQKAAITGSVLKQSGIDKSIDSIKSKITIASRELADWHKVEADRLISEFGHFVEAEDSTEFDKRYANAVSAEAIKAAKNDPIKLKQLTKLANDISAFLKSAKGYNDFDVKSDDPDIIRFVNEIRKAYSEVLDVIPHVALDNEIAHIYADNISTNPLIKSGLLDVMDGFYKTYGSMWKFHDIMENGTPLLQVIMKDVMGDIDAKRIQDMKRHKQYLEKIKALQKEAAEHGLSIDLTKIVTDDGRFVQNYKKEFADELQKRYAAVMDAIAKHGKYSVEHLKAQHAYEGFKAFHVNQEADQKYYIDKYKALEDIFNIKESNPNYPYREEIVKTYAKYKQLQNEVKELLGSTDVEDRSEAIKTRIKEIYSEITNIKSTQEYDNDSGSFNTKNGASYAAAELINRTEQLLAKIESLYYNKQPRHGFEERLKECLATIATKEKRNANGVPTVAWKDLENDTEYKKAQSWIANNAMYNPVGLYSEQDYKNSVYGKISEALILLGLAARNSKHYGGTLKTAQMIRRFNDGKGIKDAVGVYNGNLLTEDEKKKLRDAQNFAYTSGRLSIGTDRCLIGNANRVVDEHYSQRFYNRMSRTGGLPSSDYYIVVTTANKVLEKYYNPATQTVNIFDIKDTEEGRKDLAILKDCYQKLAVMDKFAGSAYEAADREFIETHVDFKTNDSLFEQHKQRFAYIDKDTKYSAEYKELITWVLYNTVAKKTDSGEYIRDAQGNLVYDIEWESKEVGVNPDGTKDIKRVPVPNRRLYGYIQLKEVLPEGETREQWIDEKLAEAHATVDKYIRTTETKYYQQARDEAAARDSVEPGYWKRWYAENHVYNPYTRQIEPLACWLTKEFKYEEINNNAEFAWQPKASQMTRTIKDGKSKTAIGGEEIEVYVERADRRNKNYNPNVSVADNYIVGSNPRYDNDVELNEYEVKMRDFLQSVLLESASNNYNAHKFFEKGYLPRMSKPEPLTLGKSAKEIGKLFGLNVSTETGKSDFASDKEIDYAFDILPDMPNIKALTNKDIIDKQEKIKELKKREITRDKYNSDKEFEDAIDERTEEIDRLKKEIEDIRNSIQNKNWYEVIDTYLSNASRYNAVQDNKQKLYFLLRSLENMQMYSRKYGASGDLKKEQGTRNAEDTVYATDVDNNLVLQLKNQIRRLLYEQYKQPENKLTTIANQLQGFTSASYMMMNIRGGIANVTLGNTGILAEAAAKEFINASDWRFGRSEWRKGVIGYGRRGFFNMLGQDQCFNKQDAIIQYFNVVDYDEHTGVVRELSLDEYAEKLRDLMFSPQTMGEHYMQNSVLFAMLHSHKLVKGENGSSVIMSRNQYIQYKQAELLQTEVLTDEQKQQFEEFKETIKQDANVLKDYAWFRKDAITEFVYLHCPKEVANDYIKKRDELVKQYSEEFDKLTDLYSQLDFKDGRMSFVEGSELAALDKMPEYEGSNVSKAAALLGRFSEKVRKVNNKIHGVYNREGAAYIEKEWFGSLLMQYHKHLPMGLLKRYMRRGHYNETREAVHKGMNESVYDLFSLNWRKLKAENNLTEENIGAIQSFAFMFTNLADYFTQLITTWKVLPEYDRANIRRKIGDAAGVLAALMITAGLWAWAGDDDDKQEALWWNLALYEADRLASEAFMYNPYGLMVEGKKLVSSPVATKSIIDDGFNIVKSIGEVLFDSDYEPYYKSGRFAGKRKVSVYIQRRIPMYHGIHSIIDLPSNNHYYKLGQNPIGLFNVKELITE